MSKFVLLSSGGSMPETEAETAEVMKTWEAWYSDLGKVVVDPGHPMQLAKSIASDGTVSDGPAGTNVNGYLIIEAGSIDEAVKYAQGCPVLLGGSDIAVFETSEGM